MIYFFTSSLSRRHLTTQFIREHRLRQIPLDMWLSFFIYFAEKRIFLCWCNFILCAYFAQNFILGRTCKVTIQEHINKTHSQNRRNLNRSNLQTKSTGSENSVSVGSWHLALRKCRILFLKE